MCGFLFSGLVCFSARSVSLGNLSCQFDFLIQQPPMLTRTAEFDQPLSIHSSYRAEIGVTMLNWAAPTSRQRLLSLLVASVFMLGTIVGIRHAIASSLRWPSWNWHDWRGCGKPDIVSTQTNPASRHSCHLRLVVQRRRRAHPPFHGFCALKRPESSLSRLRYASVRLGRIRSFMTINA
jgi:hypothetical protein